MPENIQYKHTNLAHSIGDKVYYKYSVDSDSSYIYEATIYALYPSIIDVLSEEVTSNNLYLIEFHDFGLKFINRVTEDEGNLIFASDSDLFDSQAEALRSVYTEKLKEIDNS